MKATVSLSEKTNVQTACITLGVPRANFYRWKTSKNNKSVVERKAWRSPLALTDIERQATINLLHSKRFVDLSPGEIYSTLLDEGRYICSERTMYRILSSLGETQARRRGRQDNRQYEKPELLATGPNQVWSWDITKLKGPKKWNYYHLYVILDIFSRYVVGWMVADRESSALAERLIKQTCEKQNISPNQLTIHADRGASMKSKLIANLLADLGITKTHSRPYTSNDNPFSEANFKTLKYCPSFPVRFGCQEDATHFCRAFFRWYNNEHKHSGINRLTPKSVHYGDAGFVLIHRNKVLNEAFEKNPARFKHRKPDAGRLPEEVWINPPQIQDNQQKELEKVV
tara:strand:- start:41 stop:1069 length:1029 start_codon:yes stop_codon:yes gene_type:complete